MAKEPLEVMKKRGEIYIGYLKVYRSNVYLSKELRETLGWGNEEALIGIGIDNALLLIRNVNASIREIIEKAIKSLEEFKKKL